jgi:chitinase
MTPEEVPIGAYTPINFAFALIDHVTFKVAPMQEKQVKLYQRIRALKKANPGMEGCISISGISINDPMNGPDQPTAKTFSELAGSAEHQNNFFRSLVSFMET